MEVKVRGMTVSVKEWQEKDNKKKKEKQGLWLGGGGGKGGSMFSKSEQGRKGMYIICQTLHTLR